MESKTAAVLNQSKTTRIAVIGSGISGLSTSFYLNKAFQNIDGNGRPLSVTIFEKNQISGGWLSTVPQDSYNSKNLDDPRYLRPQEVGARLIKNDQAAELFWEITDDLGISEEVIRQQAGVKKLLLAQKSRETGEYGVSELTSGDARKLYKSLNEAGEDMEGIKIDSSKSDKSVGEFFDMVKAKLESKHPGISETIDKVIDQNLSSVLKMVFCGKVTEMSAQMMLGRYVDAICSEMEELEDKDRNLLIDEQFIPKAQLSPKTINHQNNELKGSDFITFRHGFQQFIGAFQTHLKEKLNFQIENSSVQKIEGNDKYTIFCDNGKEVEQKEFDHVVFATDAIQAGKIMKQSTFNGDMAKLFEENQVVEHLESIKYGHLATLHLFFDVNNIENSKLKQIIDDKVLHILVPDSFYSVGEEDKVEFEIQQYHLMSNLFPEQGCKDSKQVNQSLLHMVCTIAVSQEQADGLLNLKQKDDKNNSQELIDNMFKHSVETLVQVLKIGEEEVKVVSEQSHKGSWSILKNALPIFQPLHFHKMAQIRKSIDLQSHGIWITGNYHGQQSSITGSMSMAKYVASKIAQNEQENP